MCADQVCYLWLCVQYSSMLVGSITGFLLTALLKEHVHYAPMEVPEEINAMNAGN